MRAGEKNKRLIIQKYTTAKDNYGQEIEAWYNYKVVWGKVTDSNFREKFGGGQFTSDIDTIFKIDFIAGLSAKTARIIYRERVYDIVGFQELGNNEALEIYAKAVV